MANIEKNTEFRSNKRRRFSKLVSFSTFGIVFTFLISYAFYLDVKPRNVETEHNNIAYSIIVATMLELLGIASGTVFGHFVLIVDEYHCLGERYGGRKTKMIKACFSGIKRGWLALVLLVSISCFLLIYIQKDKSHLDSSYFLYFVAGLGVWPLVMYLLQDNTRSEIILYNALERIEAKPAHIIAWYCYLNWIRAASLEFTRAFETNRSHSSPDLSSNKLLLLVSLGCSISGNLEHVDSKIEKISGIKDCNYSCFSVYRLKVNEHDEKYFAIQNVNEPLQTLKRMGALADATAVTQENLKEELRTFYFKLSKILAAPPDESSKGTVVLVRIEEKNPESLDNGGLVKYITNAVLRDKRENDSRPKKQTRIISTEAGCSSKDV